MERLSVGGERFATDASLIEADANKQNSTAREDWDFDNINPETASRAVVEYLFALDDEAFGAATVVTPKFTGGLRGLSAEGPVLPERGTAQNSALGA